MICTFLSDSYNALSNSYGKERTWCHSGESLKLLRQMALTGEAPLVRQCLRSPNPFSTASILPVPPTGHVTKPCG